MEEMNWRNTYVSHDATHHVCLNGSPVYECRFLEVLSFHHPGVAAVKDSSGSYHIDSFLHPLYRERYFRTFGFYEDLAAVQTSEGMFHIDLNGKRKSKDIYQWIGNYQEGICTVQSGYGFFHVDSDDKPLYENRYKYAGDYKSGIAVVTDFNNMSYHIKSDGSLLHEKAYKDLDVFHKKFARARDSEGWVHINVQGDPIYSQRYSMIEPFYNGRARVQTFDGEFLTINEEGKIESRISKGENDEFYNLSGKLVGFWQTQAIRLIVNSGLLEYLPSNLHDLSERRSLNIDLVRRLLRSAGELGLVVKDIHERWDVTDTGKHLLYDHPLTLIDAVKMWSEEHYTKWYDRIGMIVAQKHSDKEDDYFETMPEESVISYQKALQPYAKKDYLDFLKKIGSTVTDKNLFQDGENVIEAGGGSGEFLVSLKEMFPRVNFSLLEKKEVIKSLHKVNPKISNINLISGDFFQTWIGSYDRVILARVLHDWNDAKALKILLNAKESLKRFGSLMIFEMILPDNSYAGGLLDLNMMLMTGGKERTEYQWRELLIKAGFELGNILHFRPHLSLLSATKLEIPSHIINTISSLKNSIQNTSCYCVFRHSIRGEMQNHLPEWDVPLTPAGELLAEELGNYFKEIPVQSIRTSPVPRCVNTSENFLKGADQSISIEIEKSLGGEGFLIKNGNAASRFWKENGLQETIELYSQKGSDVPGFQNQETMLIEFKKMLKQKNGEGFHILFTHDMYIAAIISTVLNKFQKENWPGFLDGIFLVEKNGDFELIYENQRIPLY